jgi:DNA primase
MGRIAEVKQEYTIERVLEHYGADTSGVTGLDRWSSMRCPFHADDTASASVNLVVGRFKCFACDIQGDVLDIVQGQELLSNVTEAMDWMEENVT